MLINYLKITLRSFRKNYRYATLNILGLAIGFAAFILIAVYVHYETSYENFHSKAARIYRASYRYQSDGEFGVHWARVPVDYINELPNDMPEVETLVRFQNYERKYVRMGQEKFTPMYAYTTDPEVFDVFDFPLVAGDAATALVRPYSVVLTESTARRYFGDEAALGKSVYVTTDFSVEETRYMVTVQFSVPIILMASALVAYDQFRYLSSKNLGFRTEQILAIPNVPNAVTEQYQGFRDQVSALAGVQQVAACMQVPSEEIRDSGPVLVAGVNDDPDQAPIMDMQIIDDAFVAMMELPVLAGHAALPDSYPPFAGREGYTAIDHIMRRKRTYLINETAMKQLGWATPQEAIGQTISWSIGDIQLAEGPITGVVQDYHQETLKNRVDPTVMTYEPIWLRTFLVKVETQNLPETIASIRAVWDDVYPAYPIAYRFLDDLFEKLYSRERVQLQLLSVFSGLAIFIAFLGLFSLVAYSLQTRVREIAIRRVLGANLPALVRLIGKEYLGVMLVGGLIALPLSYLAVTRWLQSFAYRVDISVLWYVLTVGVVGALLLATVSLQTHLSASDNPADVLKDQ